MKNNQNHTAYDPADLRALMVSNIPVTLAASDGMNFDSAEDAGIYFARELDYVKAQTYDRKYPEFTALSLFPVTHDVPEGAESVTFYGYEKTGMAQIINNYATDLPRVDIKGEPTTVNIKSIGDSFGYSVQEMRAAKMAGKPLDAKKSEAARYQIERLINSIAWKGQGQLPGVLSTNNDIPLYTLAAGASGKTEWTDKEPDEILADVRGMLTQMNRTTMNVEHPDTLAIPSDTYIALGTKRIPDTSTTILSFLKENLPDLEIKSTAELNGNAQDTNPYAADGAGGKGVALLYTNKPDKLSIEIPMAFLQHPAQYENLEIKVPCEARVVGAMIYYPLSAMIAVGV